jgi:hypothetical protein
MSNPGHGCANDPNCKKCAVEAVFSVITIIMAIILIVCFIVSINNPKESYLTVQCPTKIYKNVIEKGNVYYYQGKEITFGDNCDFLNN